MKNLSILKSQSTALLRDLYSRMIPSSDDIDGYLQRNIIGHHLGMQNMICQSESLFESFVEAVLKHPDIHSFGLYDLQGSSNLPYSAYLRFFTLFGHYEARFGARYVFYVE